MTNTLQLYDILALDTRAIFARGGAAFICIMGASTATKDLGLVSVFIMIFIRYYQQVPIIQYVGIVYSNDYLFTSGSEVFTSLVCV